MADTNNERIGKTLALLTTGLAPFVDRECGLVYGIDWQNAVPANGPASKTDVQFLLRTMTSTWREVFQRTLGRMGRNYVSELIDARNRWAHQDSFSSDEAYRALDSAERLLQAISAPEQAAEIGRLKHDLQRRRYTEEARRVTRRQTAQPLEGMPTGNLKPWREVVTPHRDVASGQYQQAEFAADLHQVWRDEAEDEYGKPEEFFRAQSVSGGIGSTLMAIVVESERRRIYLDASGSLRACKRRRPLPHLVSAAARPGRRLRHAAVVRRYAADQALAPPDRAVSYERLNTDLRPLLRRERERAHERHARAAGGVRTRHCARPEPRDHGRLAPVWQHRIRIQMTDPGERLVAHPLAVVANVLSEPLRAAPSRAVAKFRA